MIIHVVQMGDTVWSIADQYGVSPQRIMSDNNIANPERLPLGQALLVLQPQTVYTVRPGDTLTSIAAQLGTTPLALVQNNPDLITDAGLRIGQTLTIQFSEERRRTVTINGYAYPYISRDILMHTLPYLTYLTIFGYGFTEEGELIGIDDQPLINLAYQFRTAPMMLLSSITEDGTFSGERASLLFNDLTLQNRVLDQVLAVMREKGYVGLDIDFEYINAADRDAFTRFVQNTAARMHAEGFIVNTDLAPKTSATQPGLLYEGHDYAAIGAASDTVLLMTYEWGYTYGPPMAVAPINLVRQVVEYAITEIPVNKILMGIPNYGYDWLLPFERGITRATTIGNAYAAEMASRYSVPIEFDALAQSPWFNYWDAQGNQHVVWFEDVRSIQAKYDLIEEFGLLGGGYWNIMRPFAQNWAFVNARYDIRKVV